MDFTKLQSATVVLNQEEYELADLLHDNKVLAVREDDSITITCKSGTEIVLFLPVISNIYPLQDMSSATSNINM